MADMSLQHCINNGGSTFKMEDCGGGQRLCSNYRGNHTHPPCNSLCHSAGEEILFVSWTCIQEKQCGSRPDCGRQWRLYSLTKLLKGSLELDLWLIIGGPPVDCYCPHELDLGKWNWMDYCRRTVQLLCLIVLFYLCKVCTIQWHLCYIVALMLHFEYQVKSL